MFHDATIKITDEPKIVHRGRKSLELTFPKRAGDVDTRKIDFLSIGGYINLNEIRTNTLWFDDVVAATSYIGPQPSREP